MTNTGIRKAFLALALCAAAAGCTQSGEPAAKDKVTVQLKWVHQAQFAGFYLAKERGFYADENLEVEFIEGGKGIDPTDA